MKSFWLTILLVLAVSVGATAQDGAKWRDTSLSFEERAADLVSRMTLDEKVAQMIHSVPAIERLGVPRFNYANECLHGVVAADVTVFPQCIGLAATWDTDLMRRIGIAISDEARAKFHHDGSAGITYWSPNINIFRDPRWGRGQETYGEDPYLAARMSVNYVKGLQGDDPRYLKCVSTPKHYAVHSGPEPLRHEFDAKCSARDLWDTYLPVFEACFREAGAYSVMGAYSRLNGEPCCSNKLLLENILRKRWGFTGYVVSDCGAIENIWQSHKVVATPEEAAARAVKAGCDLACGGESFATLGNAVKLGLVSEADITKAVTRLFTARMRLGLFDPPEMVKYTKIPIDVVCSRRHRGLSLEAARESIVLLKNDNGILPLDKDKLSTVAVIGPNADIVLLGNYSGVPKDPVTILDGMRRKLEPSAQVIYAKGCQLQSSPISTIPSSALTTPDGKASGLLGEYFANASFSGQPVLTRVDPQIDFDWHHDAPGKGVPGDDFSVRWTGKLTPPVSGTYTIGLVSDDGSRLYLDGKLVVDNWGEHGTTTITAQVDLTAGRPYDVTVEFYEHLLVASARLAWSLPGEINALRDAALEAARKADAVVMVLGITSGRELHGWNAEIVEDEGVDRACIGLPSAQQALLEDICGLGKPVVLVLTSGSALAVPWAAERVSAILQAWYPGEEGGNAVADVIFGDYNPAGRLPITWYRSIEDVPDFKDYRMANRTYRYFKGTPLFPFGFGLSYTKFTYSDLWLNARRLAVGDELLVRAKVTNTGPVTGDEVVQAYLTDLESSEATPIRKLVGFRRISLRPGETKTVSFTITPSLMTYVDRRGRKVLEPGRFRISVGGSQGDKRSLELGAAPVLRDVFEVTGAGPVIL